MLLLCAPMTNDKVTSVLLFLINTFGEGGRIDSDGIDVGIAMHYP